MEYPKYAVPAGEDITGEEIDQIIERRVDDFDDDRYTPLNGVVVSHGKWRSEFLLNWHSKCNAV